MSLMYGALRRLLSVAVDVYFVDIQSVGRGNVPVSGPVIFAANHPNSIMDTFILGTKTNRQIAYMAKSGLFTNPLVAWVFNACGVIPVYKSGGDANEDAFVRAYETLEQGGTIGIFPEGRNSGEREMFEIKTGTARIALGAEARNDYQLGVKIVPVGLNFENRDRFLSSVLVRFGKPIEVADFAAQHASDAREAVRALTDEMQARLRALAVHIEGARVQDLVRDIHSIYGKHLLDAIVAERAEPSPQAAALFDDLRDEDLDDEPLDSDFFGERQRRGLSGRVLDVVRGRPSGSSEELDDQFFVKQRISDAILFYDQHDPELVRNMRRQVWLYKDHLRQVQLKSDFFDRPPETLSFRKEAVRFTAYMIVFFLPALWGFIHNVVPYVVTRMLAMRAPDEAQRAVTGLFVGMVVYPLGYAPFLLGAWFGTTSIVWTLLYLASLPTTGMFFLRYRRQLARYRGRILTRTLFQTEQHLVSQLQRERERLIEEFDGLRQRFLDAEAEYATLGEMPAPAFHGLDDD